MPTTQLAANAHPESTLILATSPDGSRLAVHEHGELRLIDLGAVAAGGDRPELAIRTGAVAIALFERELWLVDGTSDRPVLRRLNLALDEVASLPLPPGSVLTRAGWASSALWLGRRPHLVTERDGVLAATSIDGLATDWNVIAALGAQCVVVEQDTAIAIVDRGKERWRHPIEHGERMLAAAAVFEGRAIAALIGRPGPAAEDPDRRLVVLSTRDGQVDHRMGVRGIDAACFAARRGLAVLRAGAEHVVFVDLRFGRVLGQAQLDEAIIALTVDDAAEQLVINAADGLRAYRISEVIAGCAATSAEEPFQTQGAPPRRSLRGATEPAADDRPASEPSLESGPLLRLGESVARSTEPADVELHLARLRDVVVHRAALAIAHAWDSQRLSRDDDRAHPSESKVDGIVGPAPSRARDRVAEATDRLLAAHAALSAIGPGPLDMLGEQHGLSSVERDVLAVIAGADLWHDALDLYRILADDRGRAPCDERLVRQVLAELPPHAVLDALDRRGALIARGLVVRADGPRADAALTVDPLVVRALRGACLDRETERGVARVEPGRVLSDNYISPATTTTSPHPARAS